jgi:membrane-associated phospholipid phosphatase
MDMLEILFETGVDFILVLQNIGDWLFPPMEFFSFLGTEDFLIIALVLVWAIDYGTGMRMGVILALSAPINRIFKMLFKLPRPYWYDARVRGIGKGEIFFGVPSGHSQVPLALFGFLATTIKQNWAKILIWVGIFLIGISRMVLGMHFYLDVLLGWAFGLIILWAFLRYEEGVLDWLRKMSLASQVGMVFLVSFLLIFAGILIQGANSGYQVPADWVANALASQPNVPPDPFNLDTLTSAVGTLFGIGAGAFWLADRGGFKNTRVIWKQAATFFLGLIGLLALKEGLGAIFPRTPELLGLSLRYIRYAVMGLWLSALAPMLFIKISLGEKKEGGM